MAGKVNEVAAGSENMFRAARYFYADFREGDFTGPPLYQFGPDLAFKFPHLHRQGGLRHSAIIRGPPKMPVVGERHQIP